MIWIGFVVSVLVLLFLSRKDLALGLFAAALALGIFTSSPSLILERVYLAFSDPSIIFLAGVVFFIPLIGGVLEESEQMDNLVENMRIGKKPFLALSPALLGMLPMPGGALLSAPLVKRGGKDTSGRIKASVNVWFRHILFLIYPLAPALIASAKIAELEVYQVIPYLFPALMLSIFVGYSFFLKDIKGELDYKGQFSLKKLLIPIAVILTAPITDLLLKSFFNLTIPETATLIGVLASLVVGLSFGKTSLKKLYRIGKEMSPWKFALIIFGMFTYLHIFKTSGTPELLARVQMPAVALCVLGGYVFGLITGRIQAPVSIIIPIYSVRFGAMPPVVFAITFFSIFLGYCVSPIHPCVSISVEYFKISIRDFIFALGPPTLIALAITLLISLIWF